MCGIAGFLSSQNVFSIDNLKEMTNILSHRGPDAEGFYYNGFVGLGHRRLSVLDLSSRANQPMYSHNNRYLMVYNGEVYNYKEIAANLKKNSPAWKSQKFNTSSDTEIILEAFSEYGCDFIHQLNGMFAIAIYDTENEELFLFRDRLGIKPLYYYWDEKNIAFASELKSLTSISNIPKKINYVAIRDFLHLGYIPAPSSIYQNINKLEAGSYIKISKSILSKYKYWDIKKKIKDTVESDLKKSIVQLSDLLITSVQYQLESDVPSGIFLSGGIDSSLIAAHAVLLSSVKVNTFSIGFEENKVDESKHARIIANYLKTSHHEFIVSHKDALSVIDKALSIYDEPFADSSSIPTLLISELAKKHVTVTLSGEGGDELFMGYGSYMWANRLNNPFIKMFRKLTSEIFLHLPSRYKRVARLLDYPSERRIENHIFSQEQYLFSESEINILLEKEYNPLHTELDLVIYNYLNGGRKLLPMELQALFDLQYYLPDDLLTKIDRASMQFSLETRVPYLDHRIVEFALNLSPHLKYKKGISKYILKEILYNHIPKKLFERPKQGFSIPLNKWLRNELRYLIEDYLSERIINNYGIVKYELVKELKKRFFSGDDYLFNRIWLLIVLHKWLLNNKF